MHTARALEARAVEDTRESAGPYGNCNDWYKAAALNVFALSS
jgi:hypothetical protein